MPSALVDGGGVVIEDGGAGLAAVVGDAEVDKASGIGGGAEAEAAAAARNRGLFRTRAFSGVRWREEEEASFDERRAGLEAKKKERTNRLNRISVQHELQTLTHAHTHAPSRVAFQTKL